jgi:fatty acid desaturase
MYAIDEIYNHGNTFSYANLILRDFLGITFFEKLLQSSTKILPNKKKLNSYIFVISTQILILISFFFNYGLTKISIFCYFFFWVYPLIAIFPFLLRIRTTVQHGSSSSHGLSRTTAASLFESIVFGARMEWHFEHHLFPRVPYYHLRSINKNLIEKNYFKRFPDLLTMGYVCSIPKILKS